MSSRRPDRAILVDRNGNVVRELVVLYGRSVTLGDDPERRTFDYSHDVSDGSFPGDPNREVAVFVERSDPDGAER